MILEVIDKVEKENIARNLLESLPEWFGQPESTENYIQESKEMPFWVYVTNHKMVGFIVLKETAKDTAEIFVMGVKKEYQCKGIGKKLFQTLEIYVKTHGYSFLQVKTVKYGIYKEYDRTNKFYQSMGFKEFECFPLLWDVNNPCQIYIKYVGNR